MYEYISQQVSNAISRFSSEVDDAVAQRRIGTRFALDAEGCGFDFCLGLYDLQIFIPGVLGIENTQNTCMIKKYLCNALY